MMLIWIARDWGPMPDCGTELFWNANRHLFDPLIYLVANVISGIETHKDMVFP